MNILEKLLGNNYPKLRSAVYADGNRTIVTVSRTLNAIGLDCKPFICTDDEPEEVKHEDA